MGPLVFEISPYPHLNKDYNWKVFSIPHSNSLNGFIPCKKKQPKKMHSVSSIQCGLSVTLRHDLNLKSKMWPPKRILTRAGPDGFLLAEMKNRDPIYLARLCFNRLTHRSVATLPYSASQILFFLLVEFVSTHTEYWMSFFLGLLWWSRRG